MLNSRRAARRGLNRLIASGWDESLALGEAVRILPDPGRRQTLRRQAERREVFRRDLRAAIVALGGVPRKRASLRARGLGWARRLRRLLTGPHGGDAYAACAKAAERATSEYARVLSLNLPSDLRSSVEREYSEIELDRHELGRLRWGADPAPSALRHAGQGTDVASTSSALDDAQALDTWDDEGGAAAPRRGASKRGEAR